MSDPDTNTGVSKASNHLQRVFPDTRQSCLARIERQESAVLCHRAGRA